jgi:hypothetical protein
MDSIPSADLMELVLIQRDAFHDQMEFWITATFAVIVASFVAGHRLSVRYRLVLAVLYILTTAMLLARWVHDGREMLALIEELQNRGIPYDIPVTFALLRFLVMLGGTLTALAFMYQNSKMGEDGDA